MKMTLEQVRDRFRVAQNVGGVVVTPHEAKILADAIDAHLTQSAQLVDAQWLDMPPAESGWYWHWDGESYRMHFVFARPGHAYLCTEGEPYGPGQNRNFQAVQRMGGKWSSKVEPPSLTAALQEKGNG